MRFHRFAAPALLALALLAPSAEASKIGQESDLLQAAKSGDAALAHTALLRGDDPDGPDEDGRTPLERAARNDFPEIVRLIVAGHASINRPDPEGKTALYWAALQGDPRIVDILLKGGAKVDKDAKGVTPLMAAAGAGNDEIVTQLLAAGADANRLDYSGRDAAGWAQDAHDPHLVTLLRAAASKH